MNRMNEEKQESKARLAEVEAEKLRLAQIAQLVEVIHEQQTMVDDCIFQVQEEMIKAKEVQEEREANMSWREIMSIYE